jgi:hypothetical protein
MFGAPKMKLPIRIGLVLGILTILQGCHMQPAKVSPERVDYSTKGQRAAWKDKLEAESVLPAKTAFHPFGHLVAASGKFLIPSASALHVREWLIAHGDMLGIPSQAELISREDDMRPNVSKATIDVPTRTITYEVTVSGVPFVGLPIRVVVDPNESAIRAVINGFSPPTRGFGDLKPSPEERAWAAAELHINGNLQRVTSVQTWFDEDWALNRVPGVKELHWRLQGVDPHGDLRYVLVRASDDKISYATPAQTFFAVPQTHRDDANNVLWDSQALPQGCTPGSAGCSGAALSESKISRDVLPAVVDLWYRLSSPSPGAFFQWPFAGLHKAPFDNRQQSIRAVIAHDKSTCSVPCRSFGVYYFPAGAFLPDKFGLFGHEYGHALLQEMKLIHPGTVQADVSPPAQFTEAMADFIGIVSNYQLRRERFGVSSRFAIGEIEWRQVNGAWQYTPPQVDWELKVGSCPSFARDRIGRAFYNAWTKVESDLWGSSPRPNDPDHQKLFRAWWLVILSIFSELPDFPAIEDFHAALVGNSQGFFQYEARVKFALGLQLENLGLDTGCR